MVVGTAKKVLEVILLPPYDVSYYFSIVISAEILKL